MSAIALIALVVLVLAQVITEGQLPYVWHNIVANISISILQFAAIKLWFSFREKRSVPLVDNLIGLGDLVFLIVPAIYLGTVHFVLYTLVSSIFTLVVAVLWQAVTGKRLQNVPLVAGMGLVLLPVAVLQANYPEWDRYGHYWLLQAYAV